jgi:hypothetical protein
MNRVAMRHADMEGLLAELVFYHYLAFQPTVYIPSILKLANF